MILKNLMSHRCLGKINGKKQIRKFTYRITHNIIRKKKFETFCLRNDKNMQCTRTKKCLVCKVDLVDLNGSIT